MRTALVYNNSYVFTNKCNGVETYLSYVIFFFKAEDGIRDWSVTGVQTCALPILATPEEMTTQVVLPLEEALSTISGMDEMTSQATAGSARINCQFVLERDIESAAQIGRASCREKV